MSGDSGTSLTSDDFRSDDDTIQWAELGKTVVTSVWLALGSLVAGVFELAFGLLGSAIETVYGWVGTAAGLPFRGWTGLIESSWLGAGGDIAAFGYWSWIVAVLVVTVFFVLSAMAIQLLIEGVQP